MSSGPLRGRRGGRSIVKRCARCALCAPELNGRGIERGRGTLNGKDGDRHGGTGCGKVVFWGLTPGTLRRFAARSSPSPAPVELAAFRLLSIFRRCKSVVLLARVERYAANQYELLPSWCRRCNRCCDGWPAGSPKGRTSWRREDALVIVFGGRKK